MTKVTRDKIIEVLKEVDRLIDFECDLVLIGGTAMIVGHGSNRGTKDTETWNKLNDKVKDAWNQAIKTAGVDLQIDTAATFLHKTRKLDPEVLYERFKTDLAPIYIGEPRDLRFKYLFTVESLFGAKIAAIHEKRLS